MSKRTIVWGIIIVAVIISFIISLRGTLFYGQPFDSTKFIMTAIIDGVAVVAFAITTRDDKKKNGK